MTHGTTRSKPGVGIATHRVVGGAIAGVAIVLLVVFAYVLRDDKPEQAGDNKSAAPRTVTKTVYVKVGRDKRSFRFASSPTGCVPIQMPSSWEQYVFGGNGAITIQHPGGHIDVVPPGSDWRPKGQLMVGRPQDIYTFCRQTPTSADSIVIWAQWPTN